MMMMNDYEVPRYDESEPSDDNNDNDDDDDDEKGGYVNPNQHLAIPAWHLIPSTDHPPTLISQWSSSSVPSSSLSSSSVQSSSLSS